MTSVIDSEHLVEPIDAVITWVDGADPTHAAKLDAYLASIGRQRSGSAGSARFHNAGEIDYCVTSLLKFAPWLRTIFIVTDQQAPGLCKKIQGTAYEGRIKIVDHKEIFSGYEQHLPTFNSSSILSMLWRVPGLSEQFLFLNDDFCLIRPVSPNDFFRDGKVVLRGKWHWLPERLPHQLLFGPLIRLLKKKKAKRFSFWAGQQLTARSLGYLKRYFRLPHVPHAWKKSTQQKYFDTHPQVLEQNIHYRLRSPDQLIGESLAAHLELRNNNAIVDNTLFNIQLKPAEQSAWRIERKLRLADRNHSAAFTCVQSIEGAPAEKQKMIFSWLDKRIGSLEDLLQKK